MKIQENIPLAAYTTFKIGGPARFFCTITNEDDLKEAVEFAKTKNLPILILGGGSNVLVADAGFPGVAIRMAMKGIISGTVSPTLPTTFPRDESQHAVKSRVNVSAKSRDSSRIDTVVISVAAGEILHDFIEYVVSQGLYGLENLSSIPGTVGASPVQNVAAYGHEVGNVIRSVRAFDTKEMKFVDLSKEECKFAYRDSLFKHEKGRYIISEVVFELSKNGKVDINYKDLKDFFAKKGIGGGDITAKGVENRDVSHPAEPTLRQVRDAVIEIRSKKLPDWTKWGTAGSFFKNPIISVVEWQELEKKYPDMPHFIESDGRIKIALGWVLDKLCDAKGLVMGNAGTYENQALVVVAKPGATASEVVALVRELTKRVKDKTGITIEGEVEWVC